MTTIRIRRFIKAKMQPKPGETVYVPGPSGEEWLPTEVKGKGPLYRASIDVEIDP